ncbi:MAG TPA: hypothetical protein VMH41_12765 [Mycobacteriales bacterium]|nr:hypothetical protein [Mycobacteriales bacterium]
MNRRTFDAVLATGGLVVAAILIVAGALGLWAHSFANSNVHSQLSQQQIFFPTKPAIAAQNNADITKYVTPYAGQQLVNGQQAQVYADHYIANHLKEVANGQTYAQVSEKFITMKPTDPGYATVSQERQTLFQGETLRGLLLNAYAFWKLGEIALWAAIACFIAAAAMLVLSGLGFWHLRRTPPDRMLLASSGEEAGAHESL